MKIIKRNFKIIILVLLIFNLFGNINVFANENELNSEESAIQEDLFKDISAPNLLVAENDKNGEIIYERAIKEKIYPASITKLMTAILVVDNCELDDIVTVSEKAVHSVPSGYVNSNLQVGEQLTVEDLLYAMLVPSANDAANALAEHVGGSIESFSAMMNSKAKELGCLGSNFTNPSGLQQEEHYTTTEDLYFIAKEAYSKSIIRKIIGTTQYTLPSTNKYTGTQRIFTTTNYMKRKNMSKYYCDYCVGGKTGYTGDAKNCVVEYAEKDGIELIAIVMGEDSKIKGQKFLDAKEMLDYVFTNYEKRKIASKNDVCESININNATKETKKLNVLYKDDLKILIQKNSNIDGLITKSIQYTNSKAPIQKGNTVGNVEFEYNGKKYSTDLVADSNVEESKTLGNILKIITIILTIYIIYILKKSNRNYKKNKRYGRHGKNLK